MKNKIVFMGTPIFSVPILKSLYQNGYPVSVVYTQPPNKSQRGQKLKNSPIHNISEILNLEVRTPLNLKNNWMRAEQSIPSTLFPPQRYLTFKKSFKIFL